MTTAVTFGLYWLAFSHYLIQSTYANYFYISSEDFTYTIFSNWGLVMNYYHCIGDIWNVDKSRGIFVMVSIMDILHLGNCIKIDNRFLLQLQAYIMQIWQYIPSLFALHIDIPVKRIPSKYVRLFKRFTQRRNTVKEIEKNLKT